MIKVPLFYYPTRVGLLDDDGLFLQETAAQLKNPTYHLKTYLNPLDLLGDLKKPKYIHGLMETILINHDEEEYEIHPFQVDLNRLHDIRKDLNKYNDLSILISDYAMPCMDGIDVMGRIQKDPCFKVLLTGEADEDIAVNAFNQDIIQRYIKKHSRDLIDLLKRVCHDFTFKFFLKETQSSMPNPAGLIGLDSPLRQEEFQTWFRDFVREKSIIEYYLIEIRGTFFMVDDKQREHILKIIHKDDFDVITSSVDPGEARGDLLDRVNNQEIYLICYENNRLRIPKPMEGWDDYLCPILMAPLGDQPMMYCFQTL